MRLPYEWIREYVDWPGSAEDLAGALTLSGNEIDEVRDGVFNLKLTPNRGDCASVLGVAREAAALARRPLKPLDSECPEGSEAVGDLTSVEIRVPDLCPRYAARVIRGVKVGPSPEWMQARILACGMRPVNNIVDATNYVMLETGQPLHAFDYHKLAEKRIVVRTAGPEESLVTIDGQMRKLDPRVLVIADARTPVAIAGIMGGKDTEVSDDTVDILLESAHFDAQTIRVGTRILEMASAASYRFERGVDPEMVVRASNRAAALIVKLAGGSVARGVVDQYPKPPAPLSLTLRPERCNLLLGTQISPAEMVEALEALQIHVRGLSRAASGSEVITVQVPTFRFDLRCEEDLVEEVGRILGYDRIPEELPCDAAEGSLAPSLRLQERVRAALLASGLTEANTHSLIALEESRRLGEPAPLAPRNPVSEEYAVLRPLLLPGLLKAVTQNVRHGRRQVHLFEVGRIWTRGGGDGSEAAVGDHAEQTSVAGVMMGHRMQGHWNLKPVPLETDFFALKGVVEFLLDQLHVRGVTYRPAAHPGFHPGRCAEAWCGEELLGRLGQLHPEVQEELDLPLPIYGFELSLPALAASQGAVAYRPLSRFPGVHRDLAFVVPAEAPAAQVQSVIEEAGQPYLESVELFDLYTGERLGSDRKSLAFSVVLRSREGTLTDEQAEGVMEAIRQALGERVGATLR